MFYMNCFRIWLIFKPPNAGCVGKKYKKNIFFADAAHICFNLKSFVILFLHFFVSHSVIIDQQDDAYQANF